MKFVYVFLAAVLFLYLGLYSLGLDYFSIGNKMAYEKRLADRIYLKAFKRTCGHFPKEKELLENYRNNYKFMKDGKARVISCGTKEPSSVSFNYYSEGFFVKYVNEPSRISFRYYSRWATIDNKYFSTLWTKLELRNWSSKKKSN